MTPRRNYGKSLRKRKSHEPQEDSSHRQRRSMNWRSKKLTQSAKHESCVACGADDGTIVWAHSNEQAHGKGMGIKAHDLFGAYLCNRCHTQYDQAQPMFAYPGHQVTRREWFRGMWERSMIRACEKGYL
jgi:hypothetical protein